MQKKSNPDRINTDQEKDYCKDGLCTAEQHSDCVNFQPVHDLDYCKYVGLGWTCDFEGEDEP